MNLGGLQKLTLIDYPGCVAATVFTVGCNFRCPFCHNPELVHIAWNMEYGTIKEKDFFEFLESRRRKLEGICITGGEPTIQSDIVEFIEKIKKLDYLVKLDTNGARPDVLKKLFESKLVDYVAMDIKSGPARYNLTAGTSVDLERIKLSVDLIRNSSVSYEFRTTAVPGLHREKDFNEIGKWLAGSRKYILQKYEEGKVLDEKIKEVTKGKRLDLQKIAKKMEKYFEKVEVR